jgi:hypothetical protein
MDSIISVPVPSKLKQVDKHHRMLRHILLEFNNVAFVIRQGLTNDDYISAETQGQTLISYVTAQPDLREQLLVQLDAIINASINGESDLNRRLDGFYTSLVNTVEITRLTQEVYKYAQN